MLSSPWFFDAACTRGRRRVGCVTSPLNTGSIGFHAAMGFESRTVEGYDGPGEDRVVFTKHLG